MLAALAILLLIAPIFAHAFYVPGVMPKAYHVNDVVPLQVNKIISEITQLPFAYGDLPFVCIPQDGKKLIVLNLGEVLKGDRLMNSDYKLIVGHNTHCQQLCTVSVSAEESAQAKELIEKDYNVEWIVDNLPGATVLQANNSADHSAISLLPYFALGIHKDGKAYIHNHALLQILYETTTKDEKLIVGFEVYPASYADPKSCEKEDQPMKEVGAGKTSITYTYSVIWKETKSISWALRWERYLKIVEPRIHWFSISNSLVITLFLTSMTGMIMVRTLKRDIRAYNTDEDEMVAMDEDSIGWKLCHGDVFRPPKYMLLLAPLLGSGAQCLVMVVATLVLSILGLLNPSVRGGWISYGVGFYVVAGCVAGYYSSRIYKIMEGQQWLRNTILTTTLVPSILYMIVFVLDLFVWAQQSSSAIPFGTFFALIVMWFGVSTPLVFAGAVVGAKRPVPDNPVRTHQIPRQIPDQPWYLQLPVCMAIGGLVPFAVIFIEVLFLFKSIWSDQYYYMFGFLALAFFILVITTVETAIMITYFTLCNEDYRWWWRSFAVSASSGIYVFAFSIFHYFSQLKAVGFTSGVVYFGHTVMICIIYGLCMGTIGFSATFAFIRKIYAAVKVD
ncbi:transmembrane 9 superfamily member 4-like [Dichotomocladium elegans]|nr:transmembrane 9 superfamily member 4-like [Dichotomocladium elegans]